MDKNIKKEFVKSQVIGLTTNQSVSIHGYTQTPKKIDIKKLQLKSLETTKEDYRLIFLSGIHQENNRSFEYQIIEREEVKNNDF